jgi:hypothetical protein
MNTQTFTQRRAIHAYTEARRDAIYQAERNVDAMLIHIRQHDACGCAECEDSDPPLPMMLVWTAVALAAWALFGLAVVALVRHVGGAA